MGIEHDRAFRADELAGIGEEGGLRLLVQLELREVREGLELDRCGVEAGEGRLEGATRSIEHEEALEGRMHEGAP